MLSWFCLLSFHKVLKHSKLSETILKKVFVRPLSTTSLNIKMSHDQNILSSKIILISGPTATGKSAMAFELAKEIPIEIVSADSVQVIVFSAISIMLMVTCQI